MSQYDGNGSTIGLAERLQMIRPEVRHEHPYLVGGFDDVKVKLNQNESPYDFPPDIKRKLVESFLEIPFNRYPGESPERLRHALAAYAGCDPSMVLVGNGSNELTYLLGLVFIAPGAPVVLPRPMFSLYEKVVRLYGGEVVGVPPLADLNFDTEALYKAVVRVQPVLTVITSPNNPTGLTVPLDEIERIVAAAPGFVVVDEAYFEFNDGVTALGLIERYPHVIILRTMSKAFGLAGLRIGYLIAHPDVIAEMGKARIPFLVDPLSEAAALTLLQHRDLVDDRVKRIKAERQKLAEALKSMDGVEVVPSRANFVIIKTPLAPRTLLNRLARAGILVRNMEGYPELKGYVRVNAGTAEENKDFLETLKITLLEAEIA